jgi:ribosomal protein S18 acetylase RimI-like enzyme
MIDIRELAEGDRAWVGRFLAEEAGSTRVVSRGTLYQADALPGFAAFLERDPVGLLTYRVTAAEMEVVTLNASLQRRGIGSALLAAAKEAAKRAGCRRLWLITTNDNQPAIDFYIRRGMKLAAIHKGAIAESRKLKPEIPLLGVGGRPITDELEFEVNL